MYEFTVVMALVDFIPVIFFSITASLLMKDLYYRLPKYGFAMLAAGTIDVFFAGFLKALWKLLYAASICDFQALNTLFLPTQSLGFFMAGLAMVIYVKCKPWNKTQSLLAVAAPPVFSGTVLFLVMMVLGLGCMCTCLSIVAAKSRKKGAIVLFILAFIFSMGMGYAGRLDSTAAWVNWLEQGINIASQGCLLWGVVILHKVSGHDIIAEK